MEQAFHDWLVQQGKAGAANSYPQAINILSNDLTKKTGQKTDIYAIKDRFLLNQIANDYSQKGKFSKYGYEQHGRFRAAINSYAKFFVQNDQSEKSHLTHEEVVPSHPNFHVIPNETKEFAITQHTENSSYREKLIEHLFVAELLKLSWLHHNCSLEIAKPEVDNSGYDLIVEAVGVVRHIQLKTSIIGGKTAVQKIHTKLSEKPSGCVIWIYIDENTLNLGPFLYFGAEAGKPLPSLDDFKVAKHTKGNKDGRKAERPSIRVVPKGSFTAIESIDNLYCRLFSKAQPVGTIGNYREL